MNNLIFVFLGGGLGSLCRYLINQFAISITFPKGTLIANVISCLILGFLIGLNSKVLLQTNYKLFLMTGFCGGFSTFSTFSSEIVALYQNGQISTAIAYSVGSVLIGIACIISGMWISKLFS